MKYARTILAAALITGGCSAASYRKSADLDVNRLLKDRQQSTLDYTPREPAVAEAPPPINKAAYTKIPFSPLPPAIRPVLERTSAELHYGPLGPEMKFPSGTAAPELERAYDELGIEASQRRSSKRLILGPKSPFDVARQLDLIGSLGYAVVNSRVYQSRSEEMYIGALDVTLQRHLLSPRPFVTTGVNFTGGQKDVQYQHALTATTSAGVRQRLPYGGEIVAQTLVSFVDTLSGPVADGESAQLALSGSIPLLRGAGMVNLESLINSERQLVYQVRAFEDFRRDFAVDVASSYFRLLTLQQSVSNRRTNLESLISLTERTEALFAAGRLFFLEVQRALQSQLSAENLLIDAQDAYDVAVDDFKVQIGLPVEQELEIVPVTLQLNIPDIESENVVKKAMTYRLDLQTARDQVDDSRRLVAVAQNGLLPDLTLTGSGSVGNRVGTPAAKLDSRSTEYAAGIQLDLPVDRLAERNNYRKSLIDLDRSQRALEDTSQRIIADVRESIRSIRSARQALLIQNNSIDLAQRRLEFATELLREGRAGVTARDVVEAQNSLLAAQDLYERARADLQIQVLRFLRDTGTLRVDKSAGILGRALDRIAATGLNKTTLEQ